MTDDIVTRLRRAFEIWLSHGEVDDLAWSDAADEIERLRSCVHLGDKRHYEENNETVITIEATLGKDKSVADVVELLAKYSPYNKLHVQAADEIERLRAELEHSRMMENAYYQLVQAYKWSHAHYGELPDAICSLLFENYELKKAATNE